MRTILGSCAFSAVVGLIGLPLTADAQTGAANQAGRAASTATAVENAVQGNTATPAGATTTAPATASGAASTAPVAGGGQPATATPTNSLITAPGNLQQQANQAAGGTTVAPATNAATPGNTYQAPTGPATMPGNTATGAVTNPGTWYPAPVIPR